MGLSIGARRCLRLLESYARLSGRAFPFQTTLARKLGCSDRTVRRYLAELSTAGRVVIHQRQRHSSEYRVLAVENVQANVQASVQANASHNKELSEEELRASIARKPPSSEVTNYRTRFAAEWDRLHYGWTEPAGGRVHGPVRLIPNPDITPVLADSARLAGLDPAQAILSLGEAAANAGQRLDRARNPPGLIVHIAKSIWKVS